LQSLAKSVGVPFEALLGTNFGPVLYDIVTREAYFQVRLVTVAEFGATVAGETTFGSSVGEETLFRVLASEVALFGKTVTLDVEL